MRWLFLLLVIGNAVYFAWGQFTHSVELKTVSLPTSDVVTSKMLPVVMLSEARTAEEVEGAEKTPLVAQQMLLGGFFEQGRASSLQQRLLSLDIQGEVIQQEHDASVEFWVYMPPLASRQASMRQLRELQARKLDGYLISQGELANGISLGMFAHEDSAQAMINKITAAGYEAQMKTVSRAESLFWVSVARGSRRLVDTQLLERLLADFPEMQHKMD